MSEVITGANIMLSRILNACILVKSIILCCQQTNDYGIFTL